MFDERDADFCTRAMDEGEDAMRHSRCLDRAMNCSGDQLAGAGMRPMRFDYDRAAGSECAGGVAAGDGEGEGEIRRAEDDDRAKRLQHPSDVWSRERLPVWQGWVDTRIDP